LKRLARNMTCCDVTGLNGNAAKLIRRGKAWKGALITGERGGGREGDRSRRQVLLENQLNWSKKWTTKHDSNQSKIKGGGSIMGGEIFSGKKRRFWGISAFGGSEGCSGGEYIFKRRNKYSSVF